MRSGSGADLETVPGATASVRRPARSQRRWSLPIPYLFARPRVDQWVSSPGPTPRCRRGRPRWSRRLIFRSAPGRGASVSPSRRPRAKAVPPFRHSQSRIHTLTGGDSPFVRPSAQPSTICDRSAQRLRRRSAGHPPLRASRVRPRSIRLRAVGRPLRGMARSDVGSYLHERARSAEFRFANISTFQSDGTLEPFERARAPVTTSTPAKFPENPLSQSRSSFTSINSYPPLPLITAT